MIKARKIIQLIRYITFLLSTSPTTSYINLRSEIKNRLRRWDISDSEAIRVSSLSDDGRYNLVCELAVRNEEDFNRFRSCLTYRKILEHVSYQHGLKYAEMLVEHSAASDGLLKYKTKWGIGNPATFKYEKYGEISPTLLRYAKVHTDLSTLFGELDHFDIVEIGCGFGGQSIQIMSGEKIKDYFFVDLPVVEKLIKKFLSAVEPQHLQKAHFSSTDSFSNHFDLLISNYAFSELQRDVQDYYIERYLSKSKRGYMIYNHINPPSFKSYTAAEICALIPGSQIVCEIPRTDKSNVLLIWGHDSSKIHRSVIIN